MAGVIESVGNFAIFFVASLEILSQLGFNLGLCWPAPESPV